MIVIPPLDFSFGERSNYVAFGFSGSGNNGRNRVETLRLQKMQRKNFPFLRLLIICAFCFLVTGDPGVGVH